MQGRGGKGDRGMPGDPAGNADRARQMEYLRNVEEQYQRTRELWHDLKNHIKVLEILAQEDRFGELADYLDSFRRDVEREWGEKLEAAGVAVRIRKGGSAGLEGIREMYRERVRELVCGPDGGCLSDGDNLNNAL